MRDLNEDCDAECWKKGSRWSLVYLLNALVVLLLMISMVLICIGTRHPKLRIISSYLASIICLFHSVVLILTAVFRFRPQGMLCALNEQPTYWSSDDEHPTNEWNYKKDSQLILALWII